jgi:hypothetical protein
MDGCWPRLRCDVSLGNDAEGRGTNVTGTWLAAGEALIGKRLGLLKDVVPQHVPGAGGPHGRCPRRARTVEKLQLRPEDDRGDPAVARHVQPITVGMRRISTQLPATTTVEAEAVDTICHWIGENRLDAIEATLGFRTTFIYSNFIGRDGGSRQ